MPKRYPKFVTGCHYHLYNRGVAKQPVFYDMGDYKRFTNYLFKLKQNRENPDLEDVHIEVYCLMPNHFHLLIRQCASTGIQSYLQRFLTAYSMYFNYKYDRVGPLYQGRTKARWVHDEIYFKEISRYIHRNPIKLSSNPIDFLNYPYSNLSYYLNNEKSRSSLLLSLFHNDSEKYKQFIMKMGSPGLSVPLPH